MRAWVVVAALLAGCAGGQEAAMEPEAFRDLEPTSSDKGLIRGVVVDQAIQPVPEARVVVKPGGLETVADGDGAFAFTDLEPGVYFLTASAPGHTEVQTSVEVEAGVKRPPIVRIALEALPVPDPLVVGHVWEAFMDTSLSVAGIGVVAGGFTGQGSFRTTHDLEKNGSWVQSELVWDAEQPLADTMQIDARLRAQGDLGDRLRAIGTSPLLHVFDNSSVLPETDGIQYTLFVEDSSLLPAGATQQQRLTMYTHVFYHFLPGDGWRFSSDGEHPLPP